MSATGVWINSAASRKRPLGARWGGFTLIELLVVLVVVGIIVSYAVLSIGDGGRGRQMEQEAERIAALIRLAQDEAVLQSREMGVRFSHTGYRFLRLEEGGWRKVSGDRLLRGREMPPDVAVELLVEGMPADLEEPLEEKPHIYLLSSGELTPFELRLVPDADERAYGVVGQFTGEVGVTGPQDR